MCLMHPIAGMEEPQAQFKQVSAMLIPHSGIELLRLTDAGDLLCEKKKKKKN